MRVGNWDGLITMLNGFETRFNKNADTMLKKMAHRVARSMVTGITRKRFNLTPNAESTIAQKGSSTPLIDQGDLVGSIHVHKMPDGYLSGVHRNVETKKGELANIFAIHTFGNSYFLIDGTRIGMPRRDVITPSLKENEALFKEEGLGVLVKSFKVG